MRPGSRKLPQILAGTCAAVGGPMNFPQQPGSPGSPYGSPGGFGPAAPQAPNPYGPSPSYAPPAVYGYAPPQQYGAQVSLAEGPAGSGGLALRWVALGSFVATFLSLAVAFLIAGVADESNDVAAGFAAVLMMAWIPLSVVYFVTALVWIYKSWEMIPAAFRVTASGKRVSPGAAVGFLFIPGFNVFYWNFVCAGGLCDALNNVLAAYGSPRRAPKGFAIACSVLQLVPYVNLTLAPFFWLAWMFMVDSAKAEYARLAAAQRAAAPY